jgi:hypothetical protein
MFKNQNPNLGMWVWEMNYTVLDSYLKYLRELEYGWVVVKIHDGENVFIDQNGWDQVVEAAKNNGLKLGGWGFVREEGDGAFAANLLKKYNPHFYIADVEITFNSENVKTFCKPITSKYDKWLSSYGRVDLHPEISWQTFSEEGWKFMPQAYECESVLLTPQACMSHAQDYWRHKDIQPTLGAYTGARGSLSASELEDSISRLKLTGTNVWRSGTAGHAELVAIKQGLEGK